MKKLICMLAIIMSVLVSHAQVKPMVTQVIKVPQALCQQCKDRIESQLKRYDGVLEIVVNFRKGEAKVKFLTDRTDIEQIKTAISNSGYDADDVLANPDSYARLPKTCKKTEDGGLHPVRKASQ